MQLHALGSKILVTSWSSRISPFVDLVAILDVVVPTSRHLTTDNDVAYVRTTSKHDAFAAYC